MSNIRTTFYLTMKPVEVKFKGDIKNIRVCMIKLDLMAKGEMCHLSNRTKHASVDPPTSLSFPSVHLCSLLIMILAGHNE